MKIGPRHEGCRYWGYEPASAENLHNASIPDRTEIRAKNKADVQALKAAGHKSHGMGYVSQPSAARAATAVEKATGIEMRVFSHDYL